MFGNGKKFNEINGRIDGIVKGAAIAFGVKTAIDVVHGFATVKNSIDINRLNRVAAGVPTEKDIKKFDDIANKWKNKTTANTDNNTAAPAAPAANEAAAPAAPAPAANEAAAPAAPAANEAAAPAAPADQNQNKQK